MKAIRHLLIILLLEIFHLSMSSSSSLSGTVALGAGCYWGTEKYVKVNFQKVFPNSIKSAKVGFMSPDPNAMKDPSYRQVCSGITGHVEVLNVELTDPTPEIFEELLKFFFQFHDPTTLNSQGNDKGTQYASYIFTTDDKQKEIAEKVIKNLQALLDNKQITAFAKDSVTTKVADATEFYVAHAEHQEYLAKNPNGYCNHYVRFHNWPEIS